MSEPLAWLAPAVHDSKRGRKDELAAARVFSERAAAELHAKDFPSSIYVRRVQERTIRSNNATLTVYVLTVRPRYGL